MSPRSLLALAVGLCVPLAARAAEPPEAAKLKFFEDKIRPALVEHCYQCHSPQVKSPKGGLRVDSREAMVLGGDSGPSLVLDKPIESPLLKALKGDEFSPMPPKGKLPEAVIADFEKWIRMGAPAPRSDAAIAAGPGIDIAKGKQFWAYQPLAAPASSAPLSELIDASIRAKLAAANLQPAPPADKATLLRRLTIDLTGLPPTPEEFADYQADVRPNTYELAVERLLASPRFGERWGRHWLDAARYADSNGKDENLTFHEAWRYRDYVIRAFNADKPFAQFVREQIAGDLLPAKDQATADEQTVATGFLCIGPKVLADRDHEKRRMDVVDEQIDTVGRTFMALTLGCARCHDHKFDPIPTQDYYALAGIFNSTRTLDGFKLGNPVVSGWMERPMGGQPGEVQLAEYKQHLERVSKLNKEITKAKADLKGVDEKVAMRQPTKLVGIVVDDAQATFTGTWKASSFSQPYVGSGYHHDDRAGKGTKSARYQPKLPKAGEYDVQVAYTAGKERAKNVPITIRHAAGESTAMLDQTKAPQFDGLFSSVGKFRFEAGELGSVTIGTEGTTGHVIADAVRFVPQGALEKDSEMAMGVPAEVRKHATDAKTKLAQLEADLAKLKATGPRKPAMAQAVKDQADVSNCKINIRGNPHQLGAEVPRGFLQVASTSPWPAMPAQQSGRLELANWLADPQHPLVPRVYANRTWMLLIGEGLVRSADNFGIQGEKPSHPELLDALASRFLASGGSTKALIRGIVLSQTYRQSSQASPAALKADPENRLLSRAHRRRVQAEVIRDSMLAVAGQLSERSGGSAVEPLGEHAIDNSSKGGLNAEALTCRSVYLPIIRNDVPALLDAFDFANPDVATIQRDATTVPTQALYLMNSAFAMEQAAAAAKRLLAQPGDDAERVRTLYLRALSRPATAEEVERTVQFVRAGERRYACKPDAKTDPRERTWAVACQALFASTEFRFVE